MKIYKNKSLLFSNGGGGTRARRVGPGSVFAILSMNNTLNRTKFTTTIWSRNRMEGFLNRWVKMCTIALNFIFFVTFRLHNECFISLNHLVLTAFSKSCITDETSNARHFMIISRFNFTYWWFIYLVCFKVQIVSHRRDNMHYLAWKIILVKTYQSRLSLQQ